MTDKLTDEDRAIIKRDMAFNNAKIALLEVMIEYGKEIDVDDFFHLEKALNVINGETK